MRVEWIDCGMRAPCLLLIIILVIVSRAAQGTGGRAKPQFLLVLACTDKRYESGRGQPHSKTLRKKQRAEKRASVLECGCPLPLFGIARTCAIRH
jgi:hypothetical protein